MLSDFRKFLSGGGLPKHPKKHHKPFRIHHVTLFFIGVCLIIISAFGIGFTLGRSNQNTFIPTSRPAQSETQYKKVKSSLGFQFSYSGNLFYAEGESTNRTNKLSGDELSSGYKLTSVSLRPNPNAVDGKDALAKFSIETEENSSAFDSFKSSGKYSSNAQALESYYSPDEDEYFNYKKQSETKDKIGDKNFTKIVYKQVPKFGSGSKPIYQTAWLGINQDRPIKVQVRGLLDPKGIPAIYNPVIDSLKFGVVTGSAIEPLGFFGLFDQEDEATKTLDVNAVSPAVVKIYHFICGRLVLEGKAYGDNVCGATIGSGFLISSDGVIATNGHVVSKNAADILVEEFLKDPELLAKFAVSEGLTPKQAAQSEIVASLLAKIYDLPESTLRLENQQELILASLGEDPVNINSGESIKDLQAKIDSNFIKKAQLIAIDYEPKDLLVIEQGTETGFTASDVALLKVNVSQAPVITLADSGALQQNENISLVGFPSDAENNLTSNTIVSPTVTNGTISSIRQAKGSGSKLFQTDADASQGNSGGPALTDSGQAFGILTYRFKDGALANAAKSYVRDIADLKELTKTNKIELNTDSDTQKHWEKGLELFNNSRFSAALNEFEIVYNNYPAHRLVNIYANQAQQAIEEGKDIKGVNYGLLGLVYGAIAGVVGVTIGAALIIHHHKHHQAYKANYSSN